MTMRDMHQKAQKDPRREAYRLLLRHEAGEGFVNLLLPKREARDDRHAAMSDSDRALLTRLLYGCVEKKLALDYAIAAFKGAPADTLEPETRTILRIGLYQLYYMKKIPTFAAVSESVSLARHAGERSLVNALLRRAAAEGQPLPDRGKNTARYLSVAYSFPLPTVRFFLSLYSEEETEALLSAFSEERGLTIRVNTCRTTRDSYLSLLRDAGIEAAPTPYAPHGIRLTASADPKRLPRFYDGYFFVQDEASQIEGAALDVSPEMRVLDICACPGGKSFSAACCMENRGRVVSCDISEKKLPLIREGADRLGLSIIETHCHNGEERLPPELGRESFDRVIADLPCSGFGVFGKKPDLRYAPIERLSELLPIQAAILRRAGEATKRGGVLLYSTCTLNPRENREQVDAFLAEHPDFSLEDFTVGALSSENGCLTLLPHIHRCDGFFIAKLRRSR